MGKFSEWARITSIWRAKYCVPIFSPTQVRLGHKCTKHGCRATKNLARHHRGHEYLLACYREDLYAKRYIEFHPEDVVWLCEKHHKAVHKLIDTMLPVFYRYIDARSSIGKEPEQDVLEVYRKGFRKLTDAFLARKDRRKRKKKTFLPGKNHV